jgi:hypothetical protein
VALNMTELILRQLGATSEQTDRERERMRSELSGSPISIEPFATTPARSGAGATDRPRDDAGNQ